MRKYRFVVILIVIIALNSVLGFVRINYIEIAQNVNFKILYKSILICILFITIKKSSVSFYIKFKNNHIFIPVILLLVILSIYFVDKKLYDFGSTVSLTKNLTFFSSCIAVGFFEELLFRSFVFSNIMNLRKNKGDIILPILISSVIFGIAHLPNYFFNYINGFSVINQTFLAIAIGFFLQSLYLRINNLLFIGVFHGILNYIGSYKTRLAGFDQALSDESSNLIDLFNSLLAFGIITILILIPLSLWLLRPIRKGLKHDL